MVFNFRAFWVRIFWDRIDQNRTEFGRLSLHRLWLLKEKERERERGGLIELRKIQFGAFNILVEIQRS